LSSDYQSPVNDNIPFFELSIATGIVWLEIWIILHTCIIAFLLFKKTFGIISGERYLKRGLPLQKESFILKQTTEDTLKESE
jgi:hypothetical protein